MGGACAAARLNTNIFTHVGGISAVSANTARLELPRTTANRGLAAPRVRAWRMGHDDSEQLIALFVVSCVVICCICCTCCVQVFLCWRKRVRPPTHYPQPSSDGTLPAPTDHAAWARRHWAADAAREAQEDHEEVRFQDGLAALPTHVWSSTRPSGRVANGPEAVLGTPGDECVLCMERFEDNAPVLSLPICKHYYHRACIGAHAPANALPRCDHQPSCVELLGRKMV